MELNLARSSHVPLYRQIVEQIRRLIEGGRLRPGSRLPTVRDLALELGLTRLTVHTAYAELQSQGHIQSHVGRGTFVASAPPATEGGSRSPAIWPSAAGAPNPPLPVALVQDRTQHRLAELMRLSEQPNLLSFAQAIPAPESYPQATFEAAMASMVHLPTSLGYGPIQGDLTLRGEVSTLLESRGLHVTPDDILINGGAQQGVFLALQAFCRPHDTVLVEEPTYSGVIELAMQRGQRLAGVPSDDNGIDLGALDQMCEAVRPRILYTVPTFHNPTGVSLAADRRRRLLSLAEKWDFLILEDDVYGWLAYDGPPPRALKADDDSGRVIYIGSFSKVLFPALRLGAIVAVPPLLVELAAVRESCDLVSSLLLQRALAEWLRRGCFEGHLQRTQALYRERRDAMREALQTALPQCSWHVPQGGFSVWISLPPGTSEREFFIEAVENGVGVARGSGFYHQPNPGAHIRLSFAAQSPSRIAEGVARLGQLLSSHLTRRHTALVRASREASPLV